MLSEKERAAVLPAAPRYGNVSKINNTTGHATQSSKKFKEQLGLLLFHLHSTLSQSQRKIGWQLFEILLVQYLGVKGGL